MMMRYSLLFAGLSSIALGFMHIPRIWALVFPQWDAELNGVSLLNRKLINTVLIALCLAVAILGVLTLYMEYPSDFSVFQITFLLFCFLFWLWRTVWQILYFPYRRLNPAPALLSLHIVLIVIFAVNTLAYLAPVVASFLSTGKG